MVFGLLKESSGLYFGQTLNFIAQLGDTKSESVTEQGEIRILYG